METSGKKQRGKRKCSMWGEWPFQMEDEDEFLMTGNGKRKKVTARE